MIPEPRVQFLPGDCIPLDTIDPRTNGSQFTLAGEEGGSRTFDQACNLGLTRCLTAS
jgi:hypothetical protein